MSESECIKLAESDSLLMAEVIGAMDTNRKSELPQIEENIDDEEGNTADYFEESEEDDDDYSFEDDMMEIEDYSELDDPLTKNS